MILVPNFLANEFRDSFKQQMGIEDTEVYEK